MDALLADMVFAEHFEAALRGSEIRITSRRPEHDGWTYQLEGPRGKYGIMISRLLYDEAPETCGRYYAEYVVNCGTRWFSRVPQGSTLWEHSPPS